MSRHLVFDRSLLELDSLVRRGYQHSWTDCRHLHLLPSSLIPPDLSELSTCILTVCRHNRPVILLGGAHSLKLGLSRFLIDLIERHLITHLATNGSGLIHDFELALVGSTSEDVAQWLKVGQFGLWQETSRLNDIICQAAQRGEGLGEAVGRTIEEEHFPHRDLSIAAACWRSGTPLTCHVTIGADIIHTHPNCDGAALGQTSYTDFLIFARAVQDLEGGVFLNVGSAVTGPEVFLKALSMARNVARQQGQEVRHFTTAVFDLAPLPEDWRNRTFTKEEAWYYYRPWKTLLNRAVADGGQSFYIHGDFRDTIPALWHLLVSADQEQPRA